MDSESLYFKNVGSMDTVFVEARPFVWKGVYMQGSMFNEQLIFQLYWSSSILEIIQVGVIKEKRKLKLSTKWFKEIMDLCHHYCLRVVAKNVGNPVVREKLILCGFKNFPGTLDFVFPF